MIQSRVRIGILNPNTTTAMTDRVVGAALATARPGTELIALTSATGVPSVESHIDEVSGALSVLRMVDECEANPATPDAYVIACFGDTGLGPAREAAAGPVVGMTEAAISTAALIAHRFTIITMPKRTRAQSDAVVWALGLGHRCTIRAIDIPVADIAAGSLHLLGAFAAAGKRSRAEDDAEAVILGCAGLADMVEPLRDALNLPVIEGVAAAVALAEGLLAQRLTTSRASTWARPARPDRSAAES